MVSPPTVQATHQGEGAQGGSESLQSWAMPFTERSAATRTAILSAARKLLSEQGYEAMTIRGVAAEVGVDPSMVMRYYGNKAGLFNAALDVDLHLADLEPVPSARIGEAVARHFLSRWEGELSDETITLLLRSAATNPVAAEKMRTVFGAQVTNFVRAATGGEQLVPQRAALIASQLLGVALTRYVLELPPMVGLDVETLVKAVAPALQHYLTADLGTPNERRSAKKIATGKPNKRTTAPARRSRQAG